MTEVQAVALWIGLLATVVSIVLSIVAITFSILVDKRSRAVTDQTIRSLGKIELTVERLSEDTRELIKAAWDKMLGGVATGAVSPASDTAAKEIAAGLAEELKAQLLPPGGPQDSQPSTPDLERLTNMIEQLEETLAAQLRTQGRATRPSDSVNQALDTIRGLSPEAYAFARAIVAQHLSLAQYRHLAKSPLRSVLRELRRAGLLAPVVGLDLKVRDEPAYYFPSGLARAVQVALQLMPEPTPEIKERVQQELSKADYP